MEHDLTPINAHDPYATNDEVEEGEETLDYKENYWKTRDGYVSIEEMDDEHLVRARRHALRKGGEFMLELANIERRAEIMMLKYRQLNQEAKKRGLIDHREMYSTENAYHE